MVFGRHRADLGGHRERDEQLEAALLCGGELERRAQPIERQLKAGVERCVEPVLDALAEIDDREIGLGKFSCGRRVALR